MSHINSSRDYTIDIAKAIGIIFVVIGHCCAVPNHGGNVIWQMYISDYIYTFHMPLFFFLSGYFFNKLYLDNKFNFIKKKITGLWVPYIKWTLFFTLMHNTLFSIGMYGNFKDSIPTIYDIQTLIKSTLSTLFFLGGDQLIGGFWFIPTLFYASIFSLFMMWLIKLIVDKLKIINNENSYYILILISISLFIIISSFITYFPFSIQRIGISNRTFLASAIFLTGHLTNIITQKYKGTDKVSTDILLICIGLIITLFISIYYPADFSKIFNWYDSIYIWLAGCIGTWCWVLISKYISKLHFAINNILVYIGKNTIIILALHFSCFKLINLIKIYYYDLDDVAYGSFPIIANDPSSNNIVWMSLYIISGIFIPIIIKWFYDKIKFTIIHKNLY